MGLVNDTHTKDLIEYWVGRGYDSDELVSLGGKKSIKFLIELSYLWPEMDNEILMNHIVAFVKQLTISARDRNNKQLKRI